MKASVYTRPAKPLSLPVTPRRHLSRVTASAVDLPQPVIVQGSTDCFVTPPEIAERMANYAELESGHTIGDPEAGTGNLLQAVIDSGLEVDIWGNELNAALMHHLQQRFNGLPRVTLTQGDFLASTAAPVDRFIMNPPYSRRQAYPHIHQARQLLTQGGLIIALVPCTFQVDHMQILEALPAVTFAATEVIALGSSMKTLSAAPKKG